MRRNSLLLLPLLLLFLTSCSSNAPRKLRLELPAYSFLHREDYLGVVLTGFLVAASPEDFDLNREIVSFFIPEFERALSLPVTTQSIPIDGETSFQRPDFWQALAPQSSRRLYVTGKAALTRQVRKSVLGEVPGEDPFSPERKIVERTLFSLSLRLLLIRGESGEILLDRDFKEARTYVNPNQRTDFAFHDLAMRIRTKLFRPISGVERIQARYLLPK